MLSAQYDLETIELHAFADDNAEIARLAGLALDADEEARNRIKELEEEIETGLADAKRDKEDAESALQTMQYELEEVLRELHAALRNAKRIGNREGIEAAVAKLDELVA